MHSPYTPDLDAPNMANPFEAETFRAGGGLGKVSLKTGLGSLRGGIRESITSSLKIVFKSPRNIKRIMKGSSDEAIEFAIKNWCVKNIKSKRFIDIDDYIHTS
jgi:phage tail tube protein FII